MLSQFVLRYPSQWNRSCDSPNKPKTSLLVSRICIRACLGAWWMYAMTATRPGSCFAVSVLHTIQNSQSWSRCFVISETVIWQFQSRRCICGCRLRKVLGRLSLHDWLCTKSSWGEPSNGNPGNSPCFRQKTLSDLLLAEPDGWPHCPHLYISGFARHCWDGLEGRWTKALLAQLFVTGLCQPILV